ncbi:MULTISPECIES: winged helix-turn-helix domain-containing protein [unclassified Kribbella]|uniref:winged helix-turn-helix domain-containing protein n=1 Tax=unclassified Kribbella TaxID=2644121 RepID=UPI0030194009
MPSSRKRRTSLLELEIELLWGAWSELGVSGWGRTHRDWVVDPEPLIVRTAEVADSDPRLRDEALDWCIHYWRYVSRVRLRGLLRGRTDEAAEAWGWFAATVNKHSTARWPGSTDEISYKITGRSSLTTMKQPSRAWLRMRAAFGVGARTEILRYFLSGPSLGSTTAIAEWVGYAKSNVVNECDALEKAGVLRRRHIGNRFYYSLAHREALQNFVGDIAPHRPSWAALLGVTSTLVDLEQAAATLPNPVLMVESHRVNSQIDDLLDQLEIEERPDLSRPDEYWPKTRDFAYTYLSAWASGAWDPASPTRRSPGPKAPS